VCKFIQYKQIHFFILDNTEEEQSNKNTEKNHRVETPIDVLMAPGMVEIKSKSIDRITIFFNNSNRIRLNTTNI